MAIIDQLQKISDTVWELPATYKEGMRVPARIIATEKLVREMNEAVYQQISNVATLPGITRYALCMPDGHSGYGFPIGGVAAMDVREGGVISPGGIGFDINCGMRLVATNLTRDDVQPHLRQIVDLLFQRVPAGVGSHGFLKLSRQEFRDVVEQGARWCVEHDYGWDEDLEVTEENGCIAGADAAKISERAIDRGHNQVGTLGSGNHYLEVQVARPEDVRDKDLGRRMIYDVAHNTAKLEKHAVDGKERKLLVHRKGATRAFGPGHEEVAARYREIGQPVIIGGSMETGSYLLVGTSSGDQTFFSTAHGSGRTMSRTKARKQWRGEKLLHEMEARGIYVRTTSMRGLAEEAGAAYKDIDEVIEATELAGISKPVA